MVLGGLSQGCAATLISLLSWQGRALAAVFGFCGSLPLQQHISEFVGQDISGDEDVDIRFARDPNEDQEFNSSAQAVTWLREEIDLPVSPTCAERIETSTSFATSALPTPTTQLSFQQTPVFLAHGVKDEKVIIRLGHQARDCIKRLQTSVEWREYEDLGHWYSGQMLEDLVEFLKDKTHWTEHGCTIKSKLNLNVSGYIKGHH